SLYFSFTILSKLYIKFLISYNVKVAPFSSKYSYLSFSTNNDNSNGIQLSKSSLLCFKSRKEFAIKFKFIFTFFSRSEEHTSELQSRFVLVCRLLLEKKKSRSRVSVFGDY